MSRDITVRYQAIDGYKQSRRFKSLDGARRYAAERVGATPTIGSHYAVSDDGVGKVTVNGATIHDLFPNVEPEYGSPEDYARRDAQERGAWEDHLALNEEQKAKEMRAFDAAHPNQFIYRGGGRTTDDETWPCRSCGSVGCRTQSHEEP
jgi:hypothetical protein